MTGKSGSLIRLLAGGYLTYLGIHLTKGAFGGETDNAVLFASFGIAFLVIGIVVLFLSIKSYNKYEEPDEIENEADEEDEVEIEDDSKDQEEE